MKTYAPVTADQTASDAFAAILRHNLDKVHSWQDKARDWQDIEGVHQVRVSFRRLRSAFSVFRPVLAGADRKHWSKTIRALVDETGMARDIDVLIDEGLPEFHAERLDIKDLGEEAMLAVLAERRETAYVRVRAMLDSDAYAAFHREFPAWIDRAGWYSETLSEKKSKRLNTDVTTLATRLLDRQDTEVLSHGDGIENHDAEEMHRLRIECKKLRYAGEFFMTVFDGMAEFLKHMKGMQDTLGLMNDAAVMHHMMDDLVPADADPELRRYAEILIAWRAEQYAAKEDQLSAQWTEFLEAERPWDILASF